MVWRSVALAVLISTSSPGVAPQEQPPSKGVPKTYVDLTPAELAKQVSELKRLAPDSSQEMLPEILRRVGATVADFFDNFSNTTCIERVASGVVRPGEAVGLHYDAKFDYVALVKPGGDKTRLEEYRTDSKGNVVNLQSQHAVVTIGFVSMTTHFHPDCQADSRFRYLGRETVEGKDAYVIAFAQRPEVARHVSQVQFENRTSIVFAQGVAWIDPVSFRILRLRTDIQRPELDIGVQTETTEIEYSEVAFQQGGKTLWLPRQVTVSGQLGRDIFRNRHRYSDYRFFLVETNQKQEAP
jgi:hypothetical protein